MRRHLSVNFIQMSSCHGDVRPMSSSSREVNTDQLHQTFAWIISQELLKQIFFINISCTLWMFYLVDPGAALQIIAKTTHKTW